MSPSWNPQGTGQGYHAVRKYTKFVDLSKFALALVAAFIVIMLIVIPIRNGGDNGTRLVFTSIEKSSVVDKPKMMHLHYQGMDSKDEPFNVTADAGWQVDEETIHLENPKADVILKDGKWVALTAKEGTLNTKKKLIDAKGSVDIFYDEGYEFTTEFMHVDIGAKTITSDQLVKGQGATGTLNAQGGFIATQNDGRIFFKGPVHMVIYTHGGKS